MTTSTAIDQLWNLADQIVNAASGAEIAKLMNSFDGNPMLLQQFCRAIKTNGSRVACPDWLVRSLESKA